MPKKKILVVDDEKGFLQMVEDALSPRYEIIKAHNGQEALDAMSGQTPHLLILDVNMPVMSGIEFYTRLLGGKRRSDVPTLVVTARSQMEDMFRDIGVDGFLAKPFAMGDLFSEIETILIRRGGEKSPSSGKRKALLTEDDPTIAYEIMSFFTQAGYDMTYTASGYQALEKVAENEYDIAIVKLNLDEIGGDEVACKIRSFRPHDTPVLIYTAKQGTGQSRNAQRQA